MCNKRPNRLRKRLRGSKFILDLAMGDIPTEEAPSEGPGLFDTGGLSAGGQLYTNTEIGKYIYGGEARGVAT